MQGAQRAVPVRDQDLRWQQLRAAFATEMEERVRALNELLLKIERGTDGGPVDAEILDALFREAHNLKGAARAVELAPVERLANGIESALDELRQSGAHPTAAWFDALYPAVDTIERAAQTEGVPASELDGVLERLETARIVSQAACDDNPPAPLPTR